MLVELNKAIINANLGFSPMDNGEMLIINIPPLTEERRRELAKRSKAEAENCKVSIRSARKDANDEIKQLGKDGLPEDSVKDAEASIQKLTDSYITKIDAILKEKDAEIMKV
jgi:ribosome recycling factor